MLFQYKTYVLEKKKKNDYHEVRIHGDLYVLYNRVNLSLEDTKLKKGTKNLPQVYT